MIRSRWYKLSTSAGSEGESETRTNQKKRGKCKVITEWERSQKRKKRGKNQKNGN